MITLSAYAAVLCTEDQEEGNDMKRQMKLRNTILITMILITTTILLLLGYASNRQFRTLLTDRMVDDYQETVNTMQKNVETLINYAQDFTKYMALNDGVLDAILQYESMTVFRIWILRRNRTWKRNRKTPLKQTKRKD